MPSAVPTVGANDAKHFVPVDIVTLALPREDYATIAAALIDTGSPNTIELFDRLPTMMSAR
ncbi:MAG: hypothetical protein EOO38_30305 [Cytophagaceae bacterium]|nr:MAG: hypothetical protein EOO38_30305 [Cytophagaceae bacterium]